jgi:Putative small multi-drug export protein
LPYRFRVQAAGRVRFLHLFSILIRKRAFLWFHSVYLLPDLLWLF